MHRRTLLAAMTTAALVPGRALFAQDCFSLHVAEMQAVFDARHAAGIGFHGGQFAALSPQVKWYWTANLLAAQARRAVKLAEAPMASSSGGFFAFLKSVYGVEPDESFLHREAELFLTLDAAETCFAANQLVTPTGVELPTSSDRYDLSEKMREFL